MAEIAASAPAAPRVRAKIGRDDLIMRGALLAVGAFLVVALLLPLYAMLSKSVQDKAGTFVGLGPLGLQYILEAGGSGYFRLNVVQRYLKSGRLRRVPGASEFPYPAYAVYSESQDAGVLAPALAGLRHVDVDPLREADVDGRAGRDGHRPRTRRWS